MGRNQASRASIPVLRFAGLIRGEACETPVCTAYGDHPNEFFELFSHRADPVRGVGLGVRRAGAIAGTRGKPGGAISGQQSGTADASSVSHARPGTVRNPCAGGEPCGPSRNAAGGSPNSGRPAGPGTGSDR